MQFLISNLVAEINSKVDYLRWQESDFFHSTNRIIMHVKSAKTRFYSCSQIFGERSIKWFFGSPCTTCCLYNCLRKQQHLKWKKAHAGKRFIYFNQISSVRWTCWPAALFVLLILLLCFLPLLSSIGFPISMQKCCFFRKTILNTCFYVVTHTDAFKHSTQTP